MTDKEANTHLHPSETKVKDAPTSKEFNLFDAFLGHQDLLLYLTTQHVEPQEFFTLYSVSKPFHYLVNLNMTSYILSSARRWARLTPTRPAHADERIHYTNIPGVAGNISRKEQIFRAYHKASQRLRNLCGTEPTPPGFYSNHDITTLLPFRCYGHLCSTDPTQQDYSAEVQHVESHRQATALTSVPLDDVLPSSHPESSTSKLSSDPARPLVRDVPTFRYLKFLLDRARTFQLIIHHMANRGHRLPPTETPAILARISLTLDIPNNSRRCALFQNKKYWSDKNLFIANLFFMKLDMCFMDPVDGLGETSLRKLLLSQRSLATLEGTLARTQCTSLLETLRLYIRTLHQPSPANRGFDIFGVPAAEVGMIGLEYWGLPDNHFDPRLIQVLPGMQHPFGPPISEQTYGPSQGQSQSAEESSSQGQSQAATSSHVNLSDLAQASYQATPQAINAQLIQQLQSGGEGDDDQMETAEDEAPAPPAGQIPTAAQAPPAGAEEAGAEEASDSGPKRDKLYRPDQLVVREAVRRKLPLHHHYLRMITYGYQDPETLENLPDPADDGNTDSLVVERPVQEESAETKAQAEGGGESGAEAQKSVVGGSAEQEQQAIGEDAGDPMDTT